MLLRSLFRRQFLLTVVTFIAVLGIANWLSRYAIHAQRLETQRNQTELLFRLVESHTADRIEFVRALKEMQRQVGGSLEFDLVKDGKSLITGEPVEMDEDVELDRPQVVKHLTEPEEQDLVISFRAPSSFFRRSLLITNLAMLLAVVIASAMSVFLLFLALRRKAETARDVLGRMQKGDLKARFKVSIWDEAGQFALLFNRMADEIERLVERLKENDKVRVHLLQELAHDLRTPVSSLRNLIESLNFNRDTLDKESQNQLTELAFQETEYLTRLVEDLLFLALVMEPKYNSKSEETDFDDIVETQLAAVSAKYPNLRSEVQISGSPLKVSGDRHMLSRLVRNALENAFSYARSMVQIRIERDGRKLHLFIRDDGPGFSPDALASFGSKRATRYQDGHSGGRLSVGLGSVIMQVIAQAHGGCVKVANREESGAVRGAELKISVDAIAGRGLPA